MKINSEVNTTRLSVLFGLLSLKFSSNWSEASFLKLTNFLGSLKHLGSPLPMFSGLPKSFDAFLSAIGLEDPISTFLCRPVCPDEHYIFLDSKIRKCPVCAYDIDNPDPYYPGTYNILLGMHNHFSKEVLLPIYQNYAQKHSWDKVFS